MKTQIEWPCDKDLMSLREDFTLNEIAAVLGCSDVAVHKQLCRAYRGQAPGKPAVYTSKARTILEETTDEDLEDLLDAAYTINYTFLTQALGMPESSHARGLLRPRVEKILRGRRIDLAIYRNMR